MTSSPKTITIAGRTDEKLSYRHRWKLRSDILRGDWRMKKNELVDEATAASLTTSDFPQITADIFKPMDGGIDLSPEEIMGRGAKADRVS